MNMELMVIGITGTLFSLLIAFYHVALMEHISLNRELTAYRMTTGGETAFKTYAVLMLFFAVTLVLARFPQAPAKMSAGLLQIGVISGVSGHLYLVRTLAKQTSNRWL